MAATPKDGRPATVAEQAADNLAEHEKARSAGVLDDIPDAEVVDESGELVPLTGSAVATVPDLITHMRELAVADTDEVQANLAKRKLLAKNVDELNEIGTLHKVDEILNNPVIVGEIRWNKSNIDGNEGAYVVFDAANAYTGETKTYGCGHLDVMITLYKVSDWDLVPCGLLITETPNKNRFGKPTYVAKILKSDELPNAG